MYVEYMATKTETRGRKRATEPAVNIGIGRSYRKRVERLRLRAQPVQTVRHAVEVAILAQYEAVFGE
ncbi:MAG: hypothetical protein AMJ84_13330 [Acidithiobacillales bacterium SM23_46]|nr:MAG: hypothetical protein AMJ84_13330 [Acidithiobacillales bacterium SM23_46]